LHDSAGFDSGRKATADLADGADRQVKNELQHLALNRVVQQKRKLWSGQAASGGG
jgi:hypothetical protein